MKHANIIKFIFAAVAMLSAVGAWAATETVNGIEWNYTVSDGKVSLDGTYDALNGVITIPSTLGGKPVTSIGYRAFSGCSGITSVTIPNSVTIIGSGAFYDCGSLRDVVIGDSVKSIGDEAFCCCSSLTRVEIPDSVTSIGEAAFDECSSMTSVTIGNGVARIGRGAFCGCYGLKAVYITNVAKWCRISFDGGDDGLSGLASPDANPLYYAHTLYLNGSLVTDLLIPNGVKSISSYAFVNCSSLTSASIPDSATIIGRGAFSKCSGLTSITIGKRVTRIVRESFLGCSRLAKVYVAFGDVQRIKQLMRDDGEFDVGGVSFIELMRVVFNANGGTVDESNRAVGLGDAVGELPVPVWGNNTFYGWFTAANGGAKIFTTTVVTNNVTYYAHWTDADPQWTINSSGVLTGVDFSGCSRTDFVIPDGVTSIGDEVFQDCDFLTSIVIGNGVTNIGNKAFNNCSALTNVVVGYSVMNIGHGAFYNCSGLTSVTIPDSVTRIGEMTFCGCSGITSVIIGNGVTSIGRSAFQGCSGLTGVTIPDGVTSIGDSVFDYCSGLTSVTIPNSVTSIGSCAFFGCSTTLFDTTTIHGVELVDGWAVGSDTALSGELDLTGVRGIGGGAFSSCSGLASVTIPDSVTSIGGHAFSGCTGLTSMTIPDSVTSIGDYAFYGCSGLKSVTIPDSVTSIGNRAFEYCTELTNVTVPQCVWSLSSTFPDACQSITNVVICDGVTSVPSSAFFCCRGLTSVKIPNSVTNIEYNAFYGCSGLKEITVGVDNQMYKSVNGLLLSKDGTTLIFAVNGEVVIPDSVTSIGEYAFWDRSGLTRVMIPDSVTSIGYYAFCDCSGLTSVTIPNSVTSIGSSAFSGCSGLTSVTIGNGVTSIGGYAFVGCSGLTSVMILGSVTNIGRDAFYGCNNVREATVPGWRCGIPFGTVTNLVVSAGTTDIGDFAFRGCSGLTSVTIPNSVTNIGYSAFYNCGGLKIIYVSHSDSERINALVSDSGFDVSKISFLEAVWIVLDANGGIVEEPSHIVKAGSSLGELPSPMRTGYSFDGWWTEPSGGTRIVASTTVTSNVTYYAQWRVNQYTATFDANGGTGGASKTQDYGTSLAAPTVTRVEAEFMGWLPSVPSTMPAANQTYIAQWQINQYTATFNANGGTGGATKTQDYGTSLTAPLVTRTGYTLTGWSPSVPSTMPAGNKTYMAQWKINQYVVTFDANGGMGGMTKTQDYGTTLTAPTVTRTGYTFTGWLPAVPSTLPAENQTYIAQWKINSYVVTFNANGGSVNESARSVSLGGAVGEFPVPTRSGYAFVGWFTAANGGVQIFASTIVSGDVTYYAHWTANKYTVTFNANGGSVNESSRSVSYGSAIGELPVPTRSGYAFGGWFTAEDGGVQISASTLVSGAVTYYAHWVAEPVWTIDADGVLTRVDLNGATDVVIPDGVTSIGDWVFQDCEGLMSVTIPDSVEDVSSRAFSGCDSLLRITVGEGNKNYKSENGLLLSKDGKVLVQGVNGDVTIPYGVTSIGDGAFHYRSGLTSVTIPGSVESIGDSAFKGCSALTEMTIPEGVKVICHDAFELCTRLNRVTIPASMIRIDECAFESCENIYAVYITDIAKWCEIEFGEEECSNPLCYARALYVNGALVDGNLAIPSGATRIGAYAFLCRSELTGVTIPNTVTNIGNGAFGCCSGLTSVTIPDSVTEIGDYAFSGCVGLTSVTIPDSVTSIGEEGTFYGCSGLTSVKIGSGVTSIGDSAFEGCSGLTGVTLPDGVTSIGYSAFSGCSSLTSVTIPDSVTSIGWDAFKDCSSLTSVTIPENVTNIGYSAFEGTPFFDSLPNGLVIFGNVVYKMKGECPSSMEIPDGIVGIGDYAFNRCAILEEVAIPGSVRSIGRGAFQYCSGLTDVTIPQGVADIGANAFLRCSGLTSVTIPETVTNIGYSAFSGCSMLTSVYVALGDAERVRGLMWNAANVLRISFIESSAGPGESSCMVTFDAVGGSVSPATRKVGSGAAVGNLPTPVRTGYAFVGWFTAASGGTQVTSIARVTSDQTLYAHWTPNGGVEPGDDPAPAPVMEDPLVAVQPAFVPPADVHVETTEAAPVETAAVEYTGYLKDASGQLSGTVQLKLAKAGKDGTSKVSGAVVIGTKKNKVTGTYKDGVLTAAGFSDITLDKNGITGKYSAYTIDGTRNVFAAKDATSKASSDAAMKAYKCSYTVAWKEKGLYGGVTVTVGNKGKTKASGFLPDGTKVGASGQLMLGDGSACITLVSTNKKAPLGFNLWLQGGSAVVEGLGDIAAASKVVALGGGKSFTCSLLGTKVPVTIEGKKWSVKTDKATALKLTFTPKTGAFKGSFKVGKAKASVNGVVVNGLGFGSAVIKKGDKAGVTIE